MANPFYTVTGIPTYLSRGTSSSVRNEYALISTGFDGVNTQLALKGTIAGQTWTGTHTFPATTYGVTAAAGASGTAYATLDFVNNVATSAVLPGLTGNEYKFLTTTNGTSASFTNLLKSTVIRVADGTDLTKLVAFNLSALTTATTRTLTMPDANVNLTFQYVKVSDRKASGTAGGSSTAATITQTRTLNTVESNTITGASLASDTITLPAGTYKYWVRVPAFGVDSHKAFLYNNTDSAYAGLGSNAGGGTGVGVSTDSVVSGVFTIAATKDFKIRHYTTNATATNGLGLAITTGQLEVYTEAEFWKVG